MSTRPRRPGHNPGLQSFRREACGCGSAARPDPWGHLPSRVQELAPAARQGGLAYLDQVLFRWREELGASRAPLRIHSVDVRDPDLEEAADQVRIARCLECDCR